MKDANKGFTILELLIALFLFSLLAGVTGKILVFGSTWFEKQQTASELFESGRTVVDFTVNQMKYANGYKIRTFNNKKTLYQLDLFIQTEKEHNYILRYDTAKKQLSFGGKEDFAAGKANELSSGISDIVIEVVNNLMYITVVVEDDEEELVFFSTVDISAKESR